MENRRANRALLLADDSSLGQFRPDELRLLDCQGLTLCLKWVLVFMPLLARAPMPAPD